MFHEIIINNLPVMVTMSVLIGGTIWGMFKYQKSKIEQAFNSGVTQQEKVNAIENKANEALDRVEAVEEDMIQEKKDSDEHHKRFYDKLERIMKDVDFIRGRIAKL